MKKNNLWLGILVLVFTITVAGCDFFNDLLNNIDDDGNENGNGGNITLTVKNNMERSSYRSIIKRVVLTNKKISRDTGYESNIDNMQPSDIIFDTGKDKLDLYKDEEKTFSVDTKGKSTLYISIVYNSRINDEYTNYVVGNKELNVSSGKKYTVEVKSTGTSWPVIYIY